MKEIHKKVLYIIIFTLIPLVSFLLLTSRTSILFGLRTFTVVTGSMQPAIKTGSLVFTLPEKNYTVGDIITFTRQNISVTHRIVDIKNDKYQTKGDANKAPDPGLVEKYEIIGKDVAIIPYAGHLTSFTKTLPGFILLIAIPTLLFIWFEGKTFKEEWEKEVEKKLMSKLQTVENTIEKEIKKI
jgi:signal peptidase